MTTPTTEPRYRLDLSRDQLGTLAAAVVAGVNELERRGYEGASYRDLSQIAHLLGGLCQTARDDDAPAAGER